MVAQDLAIRSAAAPGRPRPRLRLVTDASEEADEARAAVPRLPAWLCLVVNVGCALALWGGIFAALR